MNDNEDLTNEVDGKENAVIQDLIKSDVNDYNPSNPFNSAKVIEQKKIFEIKSELNELQEKSALGLSLIVDELIRLKKTDEVLVITDWFEENSDRIGAVADNDLETLEEMIDFPTEYLYVMHEAILSLIAEKKFENLESSIALCLLLNSTIPEIWFTNGLVLQVNRKHEEAIYAFGISDILSPVENPYTYAHIARSLITFKLWQDAKDYLNKSLNAIKENDTELSTYVKQLLDFCNKQI